ncbi:MAG: TetR/AcrR family transcriptional regulator [Acidimicrobiales bacterium]|nr:TetR/AcrR family transcriptional regulator [Acidimicrobiales bacterium]
MTNPGPAASFLVSDETAGSGVDSAATKGERTRQRLIEIAVDRFGARGYRATSVSEIARAAGLTQAASYAYFENKEALFDAAVDADAIAILRATASRVADLPANQLVPMLLVFILGSLDDHPLVKRVLSGQEPEALRRLINLPALAELTALIADRIRDAQQRGEVRADLDPDLFASGSEAILLSLLMSVVQVGQTTEARRQLGVLTIFDTVLRPPQAAPQNH